MEKTNKVPQYKVFISYRHLFPDQQIATTLHRLLEHNLVRPNRKVPRNIRPVFMDKVEFPLEADLDEGICSALENSDCLFVICSPNLQKSKYCMREIAYFKELHGGSINRIFTILVDGTPEESLPDILRTSTKNVTAPDGTHHVIQAEVEPLFADVRGSTMRERLRKLCQTEYLRLAAAYFGCSYDQLYKRRKRFRIKVGIAIAAFVLALGFGFARYAEARDLQFQTAQAESAASYAMEQMQQQDDLLAMTLLTNVAPMENSYYTAALRSAVVRHDYKKHGTPVAPVLHIPYESTGNSVFYQDSTGQLLLIYDDSMVKIFDAKTGAITLQAAKDKFLILGDRPDRYFILHSHEDDIGVMCDYVSLYNILDNSLIREFSFRKSDLSSPNYHLLHDPGKAPHLLAVQDGDSYVAFLNSDGIQLSEEEFIQQATQHLKLPEPEDDSAYRVVKNKFYNTWEVKDADGNKHLQLGNEYTHGVFSKDWQWFAFSDHNNIYIYDTASWMLYATLPVPVPVSSIRKLDLLSDSAYLLIQDQSGTEDMTTLYDWRIGTVLLQAPGFYSVSICDEAFFVIGNGQLTRYDYTGLDLLHCGNTVSYYGDLSLYLQDHTCSLLNNESSQLLLEIPYDLSPAWDATLSHILTGYGGTLFCHDCSGELRWQVNADATHIALSEDGTMAAWADSTGSVVVVDAASGALLYTVSASQISDVGSILRLALSQYGVCVAGSEDTLFLSFTGTTYPLGQATAVYLYSDGTLILENSYARFYDFQVYNVCSTPKLLYRPDSNTALWAYSPVSGYLIRQHETGTMHPALDVEILKLSDNRFASCGILTMPQSKVSGLLLDSTGQWLSVLCAGTQLYRLSDLTKQLDTDCLLYCEAEVLHGIVCYGDWQYRFPLGNTETLYNTAVEILTGSAGVRRLSAEERALYSLSPEY